MCKHGPPGEWKLHSMVIITGDMIDDWLDDRIIEPVEHGVVAEAVDLPPVEYTCRHSGNEGPQTCLPAACSVAQPAAQYGPSSST